MAVFKNPIYRDATFQWFYRSVKPSDDFEAYRSSMCNFEIENFGNFPVPKGLKQGNFEHQVRAKTVKIEDFINPVPIKQDKEFERLCKTFPRSKTGLQAVYHFAAACKKEVFREELVVERGRINNMPGHSDLASAIYLGGMCAAQHTPADAIVRSKRLAADWNRSYNQPKRFIQQLWHIKSVANSRRYKKLCNEARENDELRPPIDPKDREILKHWTIYVQKGAIIAINSLGTQCYTLLPTDIDRLERIYSGFAAALFAPTQDGAIEPRERQDYEEGIRAYQESMLKTMQKTTPITAQILCRAYDVIYHTFF